MNGHKINFFLFIEHKIFFYQKKMEIFLPSQILVIYQQIFYFKFDFPLKILNKFRMCSSIFYYYYCSEKYLGTNLFRPLFGFLGQILQQHFFHPRSKFSGTQKFTRIFLWTIFLQQNFLVPYLCFWGRIFATKFFSSPKHVFWDDFLRQKFFRPL